MCFDMIISTTSSQPYLTEILTVSQNILKIHISPTNRKNEQTNKK